LTLDDLDVALLDARMNSDKVYDDVVKEIAYLFDIRRDLAERQRVEALEAAIARQKDLIEALSEKTTHADENVPDQFMFQDKAESTRELEIAKQILADLERLVTPEEYKKRVWNPMPTNNINKTTSPLSPLLSKERGTIELRKYYGGTGN